jgi:2'-5' RNA ligase
MHHSLQAYTDTNEFSVILLLDTLSTEKINQIRELVPPSPVRVDPPHVTLLRGISSASYNEDHKLISLIQSFLKTCNLSEMQAQLSLIHNHESKLYGISSAIELETNTELEAARPKLISLLQREGFSFAISPHELQNFRAHITIALSSALPADHDFSAILHPEHTVSFSGAALLRLQNTPAGSPRQMRYIAI